MSSSDNLRRDLCKSARANNSKAVHRCLSDGCDPNQVDDRGLNALHYSANLRFHDVALLLIQGGADIEAKTVFESMRPLHYAALSDCYDIAKELLDRSAEIGSVNKDGLTALHVAAIRDSVNVARLLLERGADVNAKDSIDHYTPLHTAIKNGHVDMCRLLIEWDADTNVRDIHNMTALHLAVDKDDQQLVNIVLKQRSTDIDARTDFELTALHKAAQSGNMDIIRALLNKGADIDALDRDQKTAYDIANIWGRADVLKVLNATRELQYATLSCQKMSEKVAARQINEGASVSARDRLSRTPLRNAILKDNTKMVKLLLKHDADCTIKIDNQFTVLHHAAMRNNLHMCKMLVDHHAERSSSIERLEFINANDGRGRTALHLAARNGNVSLIRFLIERGAIYDANDDEGHTPREKLANEANRQQFDIITKTFDSVLSNRKDFVVENVRVYNHVKQARRADGYTVFCWAVEYDKIDMVADMLADRIADVDNMTTTNGSTALHIACRRGNIGIVNKLLDYKKSICSLINARTIETRATALHMCANLEVARALIDHGAVYCLKDRHGMTPAESNRNKDVRKMLESIDNAFKHKKRPHGVAAESKALLNARNEDKLTLREVIKGGSSFYAIATTRIILNRYKDRLG